MPVTEEFINDLLLEEQGALLHLRKEQYRPESGNDKEKSELIRDILSMVNAWRRADSYIIIGADSSGEKPQITGIESFLNEPDLLRLLNQMLKRRINIELTTEKIGDKFIQVLRIPLQERPHYLTEDFGNLKKDTIYLLKNGALEIMSVEDFTIAESPLRHRENTRKSSLVRAFITDAKKSKEYDKGVNIRSTILYPPLMPEVLKEGRKKRSLSQIIDQLDEPGYYQDYFEELIEFVAEYNFFTPFRLMVKNGGDSPLVNVSLRALIPYQKGLFMFDEAHSPRVPVRNILHDMRPERVFNADRVPRVSQFGDHWDIMVFFNRIPAKSVIHTEGLIFIGAESPTTTQFDVTLTWQDLPGTISFPFVIDIETIKRPMEKADVEPLIED